MQLLKSFAVIAAMIGFVTAAQARVVDQAAPFFWNGQRAFLTHAILGSTCSSFRSIKNEVACNPALLEGDSIFAANIFFGDDYETLYKNRDLIENKDKMALAESILSETEPVRFEGAAMLWWRNANMAVAVQPLRWTYYSVVRNQAYPDVAIHAMQEKSALLQFGGLLQKSLKAGLQVRFVDRKFVHEEFNLFEAIPEIEKYLNVKEQKLILFEPGLAYEILDNGESHSWRPLLTMNISQLGFVSKKYAEVPVKPVVDTGISVTPPVGIGELEFGLNYRWSSDIAREKKFRIGTHYRLGLAGFVGAYDSDEWSLGMLSTFQSISAGLMYKRAEIKNFDNQRVYDDSGYVEFRVTL